MTRTTQAKNREYKRRKKLCEAYEARHRAYGYRSAPADKAGWHSMSTSHWRAYQHWIAGYRKVVMNLGARW